MKYKKPKYSNRKKFSRDIGGGASGSKRWWIIGGIIAAVVVIAIIVAIVVVTTIQKQSSVDENEQFNAQIKEIQLSRKPDKLMYYCGTDFDATGLSVYSLTNGGVFTKLNLDECTITGFDSSVPVKEQTITITYKGFTDTFTVEIREEPSRDPVVLESIAMGTLPKTEYKRGEFINLDGGTFVAAYSDGTTKTVTLEIMHTDGFMTAMNKGVGEHEIAVIYEEDGVRVTTSYKITITE